MKSTIIQKIKSAPQEPGIYIFYNQKTPLYIGKASNLRNRLKSYLKTTAFGGAPLSAVVTDPKTQSLNNEANELKYIILRSEIEALIEESKLIQKLKPKYNVLWMDDKSYYYVAFTQERFPKIFITHKSLNPKRYTLNPILIGPFTDGADLRLAMKTIRRYFPYCTCLRQGYGKAGLPTHSHLRDCLNAQIGRCFGYCCQKTTDIKQLTTDQYGKNIRTIKAILRGRNKTLLETLKDNRERQALEKILKHQDFINSKHEILNPKQIQNYNYQNSKRFGFKISDLDIISNFDIRISDFQKIECYDISNLSGKEAVGVLTALKKINGSWLPDKNAYRKFRIRMPEQNSIRKAHTNKYFRNDPAMIKQILTRRLNHPEWPYPDLIIIDGGLTQFRAAKNAINLKPNTPAYRQAGKILKAISFAKPQKLVYGLKPKDKPIPISQLPKDFQELIEQAIYQTHNFAVRYHRQLREKELFT